MPMQLRYSSLCFWPRIFVYSKGVCSFEVKDPEKYSQIIQIRVAIRIELIALVIETFFNIGVSWSIEGATIKRSTVRKDD